ncbi:MAG: hypothetical protein U9N59_03605 [Campylobacterota bacterium]|nr:hypothetical protein [Campylobacterota bacterium]
MKKYLMITVIASFFGFLSSYIFIEIIIYKANNEIVQSSKILFNINQLKDIHTFCMLDYRYNPDNINILNDCKKVKSEIVLNLNNYKDSTPYLNFYNDYIR